MNFLGNITIGEAVPLALSENTSLALTCNVEIAAVIDLIASLNAQLVSAQGQLTASLAAQANVQAQVALASDPTTLAATVSGALGVDVKAALNATLSAGLPSLQAGLQANLQASATAVASAQATVAGISAQLTEATTRLAALNATLAVQVGFLNTLNTAGVYLYSYNGTISGLGADASATFSGGLPGIGNPSQSITNLILIIPSSGSASTGVAATFKVI